MKHILQALLVLITLQTSNAFAGPKCASRLSKATLLACRVELNLDLKYCNTAFKNVRPAKQRLMSQIACANQAYKDLFSCLRQPASNSCTTACQTTHTDAVNQCKATYDIAICGGDTGCEAVIAAEQVNCIDAANQTLNSCQSSCAQ